MASPGITFQFRIPSEYYHRFNCFSVVHKERLGKKIMKYLNIVCEYEIVGLGGKEGPLSSALSVLDILMNTQPRDFIFSLCKGQCEKNFSVCLLFVLVF